MSTLHGLDFHGLDVHVARWHSGVGERRVNDVRGKSIHASSPSFWLSSSPLRGRERFEDGDASSQLIDGSKLTPKYEAIGASFVIAIIYEMKVVDFEAVIQLEEGGIEWLMQ